jgi:hypothetical protein
VDATGECAWKNPPNGQPRVYRLLQVGPDQTRPPALQIDNGRVVVDTSATASLPAGLISVMGFARLDIEAAAQAVRRDLDLALDASTSTSLAPAAQHVRDAFLRRCIQRDLSGRPCGAAVGR